MVFLRSEAGSPSLMYVSPTLFSRSPSFFSHLFLIADSDGQTDRPNGRDYYLVFLGGRGVVVESDSSDSDS